jgi:hypothetical protein
MCLLSRSFASLPKGTRLVTLLVVLITQVAELRLECQTAPSIVISTNASGQSVQIGEARLRIDIKGPVPDLPKAALHQHVVEAAQAVSLYYGHFPVASAHIVISISPDQHGILQGTTWGNREGFPAVTRLRIGQTQHNRNSTAIGLLLTSSSIWRLLPCRIHSTGSKKESLHMSSRSRVFSRQRIASGQT